MDPKLDQKYAAFVTGNCNWQIHSTAVLWVDDFTKCFSWTKI